MPFCEALAVRPNTRRRFSSKSSRFSRTWSHLSIASASRTLVYHLSTIVSIEVMSSFMPLIVSATLTSKCAVTGETLIVFLLL